jgi:hypothetical protein
MGGKVDAVRVSQIGQSRRPLNAESALRGGALSKVG